MKVLVIGGAGYVGTIIREHVEREHECTHLDLRPVPGAEARTIAGDAGDEALLKKIFAENRYDAVLHLAMGKGGQTGPDDAKAAFSVNVLSAYLAMYHALAAGTKRFIYTSSLSVYTGKLREPAMTAMIDESTPTDDWEAYGLSKRIAENVLEAASQQYPQAVLTSLRLMMPRNPKDWERFRAMGNRYPALGPADTTSLYLAALRLDKPGCHIIQAVGHEESNYSLKKARELLGWVPQTA